MKLLYITNGITGSGGLERVLSVKASILGDDFNYEVHLLSLNENGKKSFFLFSNTIKFHSIKVVGNPISYIKSYTKGIQEHITKIQPDVICVCDDGLKGFFLPQLIRTNAKWIYERHVSKLIEAREGQGVIKNLFTKIKWSLMEKLANKFSKFIVLTEGNKQEWKSLRNMEVIPNPLSFYPLKSSSLDKKTVICVGKISYQKGQDLLVRAWDKIYQKHQDWRLEFYGKSDEGFYSIKGLEEKNIYHFPPNQNILEKYLDSSIYVMSSRFEGFGMVLIEAMACGVPCVSFDCNYGPSDIIEHNVDGFLVANGQPVKLAESILTLIENSELRNRMGASAKENVQRFAAIEIAGRWDKIFKEITA